MRITVTASKKRKNPVTSATYDNIYDKMAENGWNEYDQGFWNAPAEDQPAEPADDSDYIEGAGDLPFEDDYSDDGFDEMNAQMEADRQRDQELLDQYGGAIKIWYSENTWNGKEGSVICPGNDVNQAVQMAVDAIPSKDPNNLVITQVDLLEGYYDPESGMTPYDGEPVWRSGDSPTARGIWDEAENVLKNLRLDTKEGWIREQASQYGLITQAKETIKDIGLSEGRFKDAHEFDVLWDFAINYDDDEDIESATEVTSSVPAHLKDHFANRSKAHSFLERFDDQFIKDIHEAWKDYLHELSEYYSARDEGLEVSEPNKYDWLSGLAENYPDIPLEELDDAWEATEALDEDYMAYI